MKKTKVAAVFASIRDTFGPTEGPRLVHDVVAEHIVLLGHTENMDEALEMAEPLLDDVRSLVARHQYEAEGDGIAWALELFGSDDEYLRGSSSTDISLTDDEQRARACRAHTTAIHRELVRLTPQEFEVACTSILKMMGCREPHTSPIGNDGGIDFYGLLDLKGRLDNASPYGGFDARVGVWLVGQAKHYPTRPIQTAHLRELVGSVELARTGGAIHSWKGLRLRPFDPVVQLIFTTGHFSSGSAKLLEQSGLGSMNGMQLATFLADGAVGISPQDWSFDATVFRQSLGL